MLKTFQVAQGGGAEAQEMGSYFLLCNPKRFTLAWRWGGCRMVWYRAGGMDSVVSEIQPALPSGVCVGVQPGKTGP